MIIQYTSEDNEFFFRKAKNYTQEEYHIKLFKFDQNKCKLISVNDYYDADDFLRNCTQIKGWL